MKGNTTRTFGGDTPSDQGLRPSHLSKQEFARRVQKLMFERGLHAAEVARRAGLTRDAVSTYTTGRSLPNDKNAHKLAKVLGVSIDELLPNRIEKAIDNDPPALDLKVSQSNPEVAWLRINRLVSTRTAMQIMELLTKDEVPEGSRGG